MGYRILFSLVRKEPTVARTLRRIFGKVRLCLISYLDSGVLRRSVALFCPFLVEQSSGFNRGCLKPSLHRYVI